MTVTERQVLELTSLLRSAETERDELRAANAELARRLEECDQERAVLRSELRAAA